MLSKVIYLACCKCVLFLYDDPFLIAIGKAFSILSDAKKREQYDRYGQAMEPQYHRGHSGGGRSSQQYYYYEDDDEFSAEEIFNLFFGYTGMSF